MYCASVPGANADMKACSEFFQCSEGSFDWLKKFFFQKCQKYIIDFYFMKKLSTSNTLCLGSVKKGRKRDFNTRVGKNLEAKVLSCCSCQQMALFTIEKTTPSTS